MLHLKRVLRSHDGILHLPVGYAGEVTLVLKLFPPQANI
ncbi:hypothetical protein OROGR_006818 [Orobanche gracilis]